MGLYIVSEYVEMTMTMTMTMVKGKDGWFYTIEELLAEEWICRADIETIRTCRKLCKNETIAQLLKNKYQELRESKKEIQSIYTF